MQRSTKFVTATVATLAIAAVSAAYAFPGPGMGSGAFGHGAHFAGGDMSTFADKRIGELKTELKITAAQEPAWQAFTVKAKQQAQAMQLQRAKMQEAGGARLDRMAQRSEFMKQRLAGMESMSAAMKELYAVLTPEQKALADQRFGHAGGPRMPFGLHGG